jgi:hypothetical protein
MNAAMAKIEPAWFAHAYAKGWTIVDGRWVAPVVQKLHRPKDARNDELCLPVGAYCLPFLLSSGWPHRVRPECREFRSRPVRLIAAVNW